MLSKKVNPVFLFLIKVFLLYISWFFIYEQWLHPQEKLDLIVIDNSLFFSSKILKLFGFTADTNLRAIVVNSEAGLNIGDACNGINLMALFIGFIIAFPGSWKFKMLFIIFGSLIIHFLNIFRIIALSLIQLYRPEALDFNHTYTFTFIIYAIIFAMWMLWVKKFSNKNPNDNPVFEK